MIGNIRLGEAFTNCRKSSAKLRAWPEVAVDMAALKPKLGPNLAVVKTAP